MIRPRTASAEAARLGRPRGRLIADLDIRIGDRVVLADGRRMKIEDVGAQLGAPGDDVRRMDWSVTARTTHPHVRQMIADREIIASRVGERNVVAVPAAFIQGGGVLASLMGTVTVLNDGGFDDDEAIRWLCTPDETLPIDGAPIDMLRAGRKAEVRKRAMEDAF